MARRTTGRMPGRIPKIKDEQSELGFGRHITSQGRLINPDGSFNVIRHRNDLFDNLYFRLITMPAWMFFVLTMLVFGLMNAIFATAYILSGDQQLSGMPTDSPLSAWLHAFFFSTQTLTTVGYGHISPAGRLASFIASFESFLGLLIFALISGLLYGRFSRPTAKLIFSDKMLIAPFKDKMGLMFRMVNPRTSELIETEVKVVLAINQNDENSNIAARRFFSLDLEISQISFFSLSWTVVHAINEESPLFGLSHEDLETCNAEIMVLVAGTDESTEQIVHARRSYIADEMVWNARFSPMMSKTKDLTRTVIHTRKVHDYELLPEKSNS